MKQNLEIFEVRVLQSVFSQRQKESVNSIQVASCTAINLVRVVRSISVFTTPTTRQALFRSSRFAYFHFMVRFRSHSTYARAVPG